MSHCSLIVCILFSSISWASSPWLSADLGPGVWCYPTMSHQDNCIVMSHIVFNSHTNLSVTFTRENMPHAAGACILPPSILTYTLQWPIQHFLFWEGSTLQTFSSIHWFSRLFPVSNMKDSFTFCCHCDRDFRINHK